MKKNYKYGAWHDHAFKKTFLIMRLVLIISLVCMMQSFALDSYTQSSKISLSVKEMRLDDILMQIENETKYRFAYNKIDIDVDEVYTINIREAEIKDVLNQLFSDKKISYSVVDERQIILSKPEGSFAVSRQSLTVAGKVTDSSGAPLPGVTVVVKGTTQGTITDVDGSYSLSNVPNRATLLFSFVGMKPQEIPVSGRTSINVSMEEDAIGIEEIVAIGYGTQKRVNLTGSVGMANSERLENRPIVSTGQGLQGVIPNLNIKYSNGNPAGSADFNVRGFESINGGSPLILVDGVPMDLERINPGDIASVSVLKDASAGAVYGSRAAFGVILVETKKGKEGKINVTLSTEQSIAKPIMNLDPVTDPYVYVTALNKAYMRTKGVPFYDDNYVEGTKRWSENPTEENEWGVYNGNLRFYGNNDYINKVITDFAPQQKYGLTVSGSSKNNSYYVSFGFLDKDGYYKNKKKNENYKRYNILMKVDFKITDWLSIGEEINYIAQANDAPHNYNDNNAHLNSITRMAPNIPLKFPDLPYYLEEGDHDQYAQYIGMDYSRLNLIPYFERGGRDTWANNDAWFTQRLTLTPFEGFRIRSDFSYRSNYRDFQNVASKVVVLKSVGLLAEFPLLQTNLTDYGFSATDFIQNGFSRSQYYVFNTFAEYEMKGNRGHYVKAMVGFNQEWGRNNSLSGDAQTLLTPSITDINATTGTRQINGGKSHESLRGAFYRLNYTYKDKYLFEASGRYDGTSRFAKDSRFGFFPSGSIGWRVSKEPFMASTEKWLDNLKLRASYGVLGNQFVSYYPYPSMSAGTSPYLMSANDRIPIINAPGLVSGGLTWESVATRNIGIDFTLLDNKLDISFDAYTRDTKDMLMNVKYPDILGAASPKENAADLRTKGWELSATWRTRFGQDLRYGLTLALSDNQSEITKYENPTGAYKDYYVGKKIGEIWGYETVGIFQNEEDLAAAPDQSKIGSSWRVGDIQYADLDGDGKITQGNLTLDNPGDMTIIGNSSPRYSFGINHDLSFKNWSLNVFFQGMLRRDYMPPETAGHQAFWPFNSQGLEKYYLTETWSEDNRDAYFAAPDHIGERKNIKAQTRFLQNAAYIRLKNLTLNYNVTSKFVERLGLGGVQVYFSGMNLWEYSKMHKPLDPENETVAQFYYFQRIFTLGAKITF